MDKDSKDGKKKGKKNKVGLINDSFELEPSNSVRKKVRYEFILNY